jgi:type I restriction enzyme M protein
MQIADVMQQTKSMIDDLKAICTNYGLGNASSEYKIITEVFLYKFLNDKFIFEARKVNPDFAEKSASEIEVAMTAMSEDDYEAMLMDFSASTARLKREHYISYLFNRQNNDGFHTLFDATLVDIANHNIDIFSVQAGGSAKIRLFDALSQYVIEPDKKDGFCCAIIGKLANSSFNHVFGQKYDFFATIFEYLIKDYNKDFGKYGEYYTPNVIARIIAQVMVPNGTKNVTVYDPAAGSGTLVLALAHEIGEDNCTIFTQDISQKSNEFLRLNLILNNLVHSLPNVIHDDTLLNPRHLNAKKDGLMTFDYIVSNPPFKMDFSDSRNTLAGEKYQKRFFAGVPNIPNDKDKMSVYLMFLQHILFSLDYKGKAAVVVPTGFLTAASGIEKKIRERLVSKRMLRGVISMPSNIFATTGTNVSILFIDRENTEGKVVLMDASKLGEKVKDGKNQKTVLRPKEVERIINTFNTTESVDDFCVVLDYTDIEAKKLSFSAGQYFDVKIKYSEMTEAEFTEKINNNTSRLNELFSEGRDMERKIITLLENMRYEHN